MAEYSRGKIYQLVEYSVEKCTVGEYPVENCTSDAMPSVVISYDRIQRLLNTQCFMFLIFRTFNTYSLEHVQQKIPSRHHHISLS
jgi:hypothetical protein